jgi:putative CocE/NonD family hydrolase
MYGEGYSGFTPWAAAKRPPAALKAIATAAASAPGIDIPMQGNIFQNSGYRWSLHVVDPDAGLPPDDEASWRAFDEKWYKSGSRYRDLGRLFGRPNPLFIRWLNHPSYDRYWQKMVPFREEFARINIPVLTTTGYYAPSEPGDLYFFTEHHRFNPRADHTLLIGPYDDAVMQRGLSPALRGYQVDAAAQVDQRELRYRWFDHVFKGTPPPSLLTDPVNYQVMGANEWHHAASLDAMGAKPIRFFLSAAATGTGHRLTKRRRTQAAYTEQIVSLADRTDAGWTAPADLVAKSAAAHLGTLFVSEPLPKPVEFSGRFSGRLDFTVNKMDMDLYIALYERLPNGDYVPLFSPSYEFRASYAQDRTHRRLLKAGEQQALTFRSERLMSRRLQAGSRLVIVLGIDKRPDREINYGTGNDVSEESLADGDTAPLEVRWYGDSYVEMPVHR